MNAIVDPSKRAASVEEPPLKNKWLAAGGKHPREVSRDKKIAFLTALGEHGNVTKAAEAAGYEKGFTAHLYVARKNDVEFREAWDYFLEAGKQRTRDTIDDAIVTRGRDGWDEPVFYQGEETATKRVFDSNLLVIAARAFSPDKYRENKQAHDININANFGVAVLPATFHSEDDWEKHSMHVTNMQNKMTAAANQGSVIDGTSEVIKSEPIKRGG